MEISMIVYFQIIQKKNGEEIPLSNTEAKSVSIGGFSFEVDDTAIPFDWDAFTGNEYDKVFQFQTGKGFLWDDYEISECYDESYEEIGIDRKNITAQFLASTTHIDEFYVDFEDENEDIQHLGDYSQNRDQDEQYKVKILELKFVDVETDTEYFVDKNVLDNYNQGI